MQLEQQSTAEIYRILKDWAGLYAPANLAKTEETAKLLVDWVMANDGGIVSFVGLNRAAQALGDKILVKEPTPIEKAFAIDSKNLKQNLNEKTAALTQQKQRTTVIENKAVEKELKAVVDEIHKEINNFLVTQGGRANYARTEYGQSKLREVLAQHDIRSVGNAKLALAAIRRAKGNLS